MLAPLLLWQMSVVLTWLVAQNIANKPYDRQLGELAVLARQVTVQAVDGAAVRDPAVGGAAGVAGAGPRNRAAQRSATTDPTSRHNDLSPIDERDAPEEVAPLVRAINDLLAQLDRSLQSQKHFLVNTAHPLKTPLAGCACKPNLHSGRSTPARTTPRRSSARCSRSHCRASARRTWSTSCSP